MEEILARIVKMTSDPYSHVAQLKEETGKKIIGCFPMHVPEELVHASGMIPIVIWRGDEPVTWGHSHIPPYNCGIVRSFIDDAVKGKVKFFDGMVFHTRQCLQVGEFPIIMRNHVKPEFMKILYLPAAYDGSAIRDYTLQDLESFKASLEKYSGTKISDDAIKNSIKIYNENRSLLERIYQIRKEKPGILNSSMVMRIVLSSMLMPKDDNNKLLGDLIKGLESKSFQPENNKIGVIPVGAMCQTIQFEILDIIEDLGMVVPDDDLYIGSRYFANKVSLDKGPLDALADRYLCKTPVCPTKGIYDVHWADDVIQKVKDSNSKGVISILIKFCPPHTCYYPDFKSKMAEEGIPEVMIQVEHEIVSLEGTKTRLQSFAESLRGK